MLITAVAFTIQCTLCKLFAKHIVWNIVSHNSIRSTFDLSSVMNEPKVMFCIIFNIFFERLFDSTANFLGISIQNWNKNAILEPFLFKK